MAEEDGQPDNSKKRRLVQNVLKYGLIGGTLILYGVWAYKKFQPCPTAGGLSKMTRFDQRLSRKKKTDKCSTERSGETRNSRRRRDTGRAVFEDCDSNERPSRPMKEKFVSFYEDDYRQEVSEQRHKERYKDKKQNWEEEEEEIDSDRESRHSKHKRPDNDATAPIKQTANKDETAGFIQLTPEVLECLCKCYQRDKKTDSTEESKKADLGKWEERKNPKLVETSQKNYSDAGNTCDKNFYANDADAPYVVKDYKCKSTNEKEKPDSATKKRDEFWHSCSPPKGLQQGCHNK